MLAKVQPKINELNKLKQTRRVLLSEKGTTGGGGNTYNKLSQEEVIRVLRDAGEPLTPSEISEALGMADSTVRSHLNRFKDTRYVRVDDGWTLTELNGSGEEEEEE